MIETIKDWLSKSKPFTKLFAKITMLQISDYEVSKSNVKMNYRFFSLRNLLTISIFCLLLGCRNYESYTYFETRKVKDVNIEIYISKSESTYTNDSFLYYLTDSVNYRKFIGECSPDEYIDVKISEADIEVYKKTKNSIIKKPELTSLVKYNHIDLKKAGDFDTYPANL